MRGCSVRIVGTVCTIGAPWHPGAHLISGGQTILERPTSLISNSSVRPFQNLARGDHLLRSRRIRRLNSLVLRQVGVREGKNAN